MISTIKWAYRFLEFRFKDKSDGRIPRGGGWQDDWKKSNHRRLKRSITKLLQSWVGSTREREMEGQTALVSLVKFRSIAFLERVCRKQMDFFPSFLFRWWSEWAAICNQAGTLQELVALFYCLLRWFGRFWACRVVNTCDQTVDW